MATDRHQAPSYPLRMPDDLKSRIQTSAEQCGRSLHAELLARLEQSFDGINEDELQLQISRLEGELSGTKFATDALLASTTGRLATMAQAYSSLFTLMERLNELFDQVAGVAQSQIEGDDRDPVLAKARLETALAEKSRIDEIAETCADINDDLEARLLSGIRVAAEKADAGRKRSRAKPKQKP
nr:Arc family DNA-binding protein [Diaphorobacter sp. HDW4A]